MTMTLHTLKSIADHAPKGKHNVPGIRQLEKSGSHIIVREMVADMEITVFQNGYAAGICTSPQTKTARSICRRTCSKTKAGISVFFSKEKML